MFETGKVVKTFESRKGNSVVIRYPKWEDLEHMLTFINELSKEDTYVLFSGEQLTKKEEAEYLSKLLVGIETQTQAQLHAFIGDTFVGSCGITRRIRRMSHVGDVHMSVTQGYRGEGIGTELLKSIIEEGRKIGLKMLGIQVFANNDHGFYLYQKVGFKEFGRFPKAVLYKGQFIDEIEMSMEL